MPEGRALALERDAPIMGVSRYTSVRRAAKLRHPHLTEQEERMLKHLAMGYTLKETAAQLNLTYGTAKIYVCRMKEKFNLLTKTQLVAEWLRGNLESGGAI